MDITVRNLQSKFVIPSKRIIQIAQDVGADLCVRQKGSTHRSPPTEVCIVFVGTQRMRGMNKKYLGHDYVTDVITFDLGETAEILICPQVAFDNAKANGMSLPKELCLYVIHGLLHLAGYDDHSAKDIQRMRAKEKELLDRTI